MPAPSAEARAARAIKPASEEAVLAHVLVLNDPKAGVTRIDRFSGRISAITRGTAGLGAQFGRSKPVWPGQIGI